ncbi:hypothetical protein [Donghicola tyrosinivorans]|uniref:Anti-sigma-K factor RskA n=1 Tax=Donghicola tyrosinivorans TaxID=1652492 RepID=A0A2T0WNI9_9RHOB|nr:hypothetical protein [Donghicola tyrosinivorans]PRY88250.1 hypothetical protein CLV74_10854 [Donghicola tyrosinivorans]
MTSDQPLPLAAELAMGLLQEDEAHKAERRRATDPAFDAEVWWWEERLAGCFANLPPQKAPKGTYDKIEARLFGAPDTAKAPDKGFGWKPVVGGIIGVKATLLAAFLITRALNTETHVYDTGIGQMTLRWNTQSGSIRSQSAAQTTLHIWIKTPTGYSYLGNAGQKLSLPFASGTVLALSADGPLSKAPKMLAEHHFTRED